MQPVTRELSALEIIREGFSLFRRQFPRIFVPLFLGAIIAAPVNLLFAYITAPLAQQLSSYRNVTVTNANEGVIFSLFGQSLGYTILELWLLFVIYVPFLAIAFKIAHNSSSGKTPSLRDGFSIGFNRILSLFVAGILTGILVLTGLVLLVVPGILVTVMLLMFIPAIVLENQSSLGSLGRSKQLVSRRWGLVFLVGLIAFIVGLVLRNFFGNLFYFLDIYTSSLVQPFYGLISDVLGVSLLAVLYQSLLMKEGGAPDRQIQPPPDPDSVQNLATNS